MSPRPHGRFLGGPFLSDPLLAGARLLLLLAQVTLLAFAAACLFGVGAVLLLHNDILPRFAEHGIAPGTLGLVAAILVLLAISGGLGFFFFRHLQRIVGTVGEGDPFIPINAERLSAMGWIAVATHVLIVAALMIGRWVQENSPGGRNDIDFSILPGGLLLALILFVLARVFREGARLRDELEGTV